MGEHFCRYDLSNFEWKFIDTGEFLIIPVKIPLIFDSLEI